MSSTDEKLDALICSVTNSSSHKNRASTTYVDGKLKKLEEDVMATQQDITERVLKKAWRERPCGPI